MEFLEDRGRKKGGQSRESASDSPSPPLHKKKKSTKVTLPAVGTTIRLLSEISSPSFSSSSLVILPSHCKVWSLPRLLSIYRCRYLLGSPPWSPSSRSRRPSPLPPPSLHASTRAPAPFPPFTRAINAASLVFQTAFCHTILSFMSPPASSPSSRSSPALHRSPSHRCLRFASILCAYVQGSPDTCYVKGGGGCPREHGS